MGILFLHPILPDLGDPARLRAVLEELAETVGSNPPVGGIDRPRFARRLARSPPASRSAVIDALVSRALDSDEHVGSWTRRAVAELVEHQPELLEDVTSIATTVVIAETRAPPGLDLLLFQVGSTASPESIRRTVLRLLTRAETTREIARAVAYGTVATHLAIRDESLATETAFRLAELARPADPGLLRVWLRSQELLLRGYPLLSDVIASDLVRALKSEDPEIRRFALEIASGSGGSGDLAPSVASALLPALVDPDPAVRALAARGAARWGRGARHPEEPAPLAARLAAALESEDEPAARVETAVSLGILAGSDRSLSARAWRALDTTHAPPRPDDPTGARAEIERAMRIGIANPFSARQALPRIARHLNAEESRARFAVLAVREVGMEDSRVAENALEMLEPRLADPSWPVAWDGVVNGVLPLCRAHPELAERGVAILRPVLALPRPPSVHGLRLELRAAYDGMVELAAILTGDDLDAIWLWVTSLRPIDRRVGRDLLVRLAWRRADTHPELEERMATLVIAPRPVDRIAVARTREIVGLLSIRHSLGANGLRAEDWQWLLEWIPDRSVSTTLREVSSSADL
jgi:hypothetical protein